MLQGPPYGGPCLLAGNAMNDNFWHDGLRFECTKCSACCRHDPGYVFLSAFDLRNLLDHTRFALQDFLRAYVKKVDSGTGFWLSLREKSNNDCILWGGDGCTVYHARPIQCSTYPFWQGILDSGAAWSSESHDCPGIGKGQLIPAPEIHERLWLQRSHPRLKLAYDIVLESIDENTLLGSPRVIADATYAGKIAEQDFFNNPEDNSGRS